MFANLFDVMNIEEVNSLQKPSATGNFHLNGISHYFGANYKIWKKELLVFNFLSGYATPFQAMFLCDIYQSTDIKKEGV